MSGIALSFIRDGLIFWTQKFRKKIFSSVILLYYLKNNIFLYSNCFFIYIVFKIFSIKIYFSLTVMQIFASESYYWCQSSTCVRLKQVKIYMLGIYIYIYCIYVSYIPIYIPNKSYNSWKLVIDKLFVLIIRFLYTHIHIHRFLFRISYIIIYVIIIIIIIIIITYVIYILIICIIIKLWNLKPIPHSKIHKINDSFGLQITISHIYHFTLHE